MITSDTNTNQRTGWVDQIVSSLPEEEIELLAYFDYKGKIKIQILYLDFSDPLKI